MYCEGCGKKLIRGYQFCIECGMPVPPEADENAEQTAAEGAETTADNGSVSMPDIQPISGEGSLVFCSTCGMHMQKSTTVCEKCGKPLGNNGMNNGGSMPNGGVPLFNSNPLGGDDFSEMSEGEIDQINSFMNGGGLAPLEGMNGMNGLDGGLAAVSTTSSGDMGSIGGTTDIDVLAQQLASFGASTSEMPAIGVPPVSAQIRQAEPKPGETREVQDFAMDSSADTEEFSSRELPVIDVGSMDENPAEDVDLDPYSFVNNVISPEPAPVFEPAPAVEEVAPVIESTPVFEPAPAVEEVASVAESAPVFEPAPAVEEVVSVAESAPVFEPAPAVEEVAPVAENAPVFEPAPAVEEVAPVAESAPVFEPAPAVEEVAPVVESAPVFEPAPAMEEAPFIEESAPFIEEGAPVIAEGGLFNEQPAPTPEPTPEPAPLPRPAKKVEEIDPALGKLSYCRNCGQDMYEKEPVCKNCGAPYKPPVKHDKTLDKKFGSVPADEKTGIKKYLPFILGVSAVAAVIIILIVATPKNNKPNTSSLTGNETLNVSTTTSATTTTPAPEDTTSPADSTDSDAAVVAPVESAESVHEGTVPTTENEETTPTAPEKPETSDAAESTPATHKTVPHTTGGAPEGTTTKPSTTTKATTTARTTPATTTTKAAAAITSPKTTSLEKDRDAIMDAVAVMSGEVGKIDSLAQNIIYAMENSTGNAETARTAYMNRDFAKNMLSSLESGKSAVDSAVTKAKPKNSELNSMYDSLVSLQKKYTAYYNFIKSPSGSTSKFTSSCSTYMSDFTSGVNGFKYTKFTSNYNDSETNAAYKAAMSDAVTAVNNAVSAFSTLQTKVSAVDKSTFDTAAVQELSKSANSKTLANAVAYAQEVQAYRIMLASAPSSYSTAYNNLKTASDELNALVDLYNNIQENSLSSYKNESSSCINNASSAAKSVTSAIS